jgi:hypothetical protein
MKQRQVNDESERMQKEAAVAQFKVLSQHWLARTEKIKKNLSHDSQSLGQDLKPGPPKYEGVLITRP